jgi:hypothetical protein
VIGDDAAEWDRPVPTRTWAILGIVAAAAFLIAAVVPESSAVRWALAAVLGAELAYLGWVAPRQAICVVSWSVVDLRSDPLLLVGPAGLVTLGIQSWRAGAFRRWSVLGVLVASLSAAALLEVFNSRQGSIKAGAVGLLFWLVPMLWFWVGRAFADSRLVRATFWFFAAAGVASACYGLVQAAAGFPPWDDEWIRDHGYAALFIGDPLKGGSRPFAFSSSAVEYGLTVALGLFLLLLLLVAAFRRRNGILIVVFAAGAALCVAALAVSGVRTAVVTLFVAILVCVVIRLRPSVPVVLGVLAVILVSYGALWVVNVDSLSGDGTQGSMRRIVVGLRNPFNESDSSLPHHLRLARHGFERGWHDPLGMGTGATHSGDDQFSTFTQDTEFDVSNGAVAFGILGIALTGAALLWGIGLAAARAWRRPDLIHLATLGLLIISFRFWWNGGHYALAPFLWFVLGWVDVAGPRPRGRRHARVASYAAA